MPVDQALASRIDSPWSDRPGPSVHGPRRTLFVDDKAMVFMQNHSAVPIRFFVFSNGSSCDPNLGAFGRGEPGVSLGGT